MKRKVKIGTIGAILLAFVMAVNAFGNPVVTSAQVAQSPTPLVLAVMEDTQTPTPTPLVESTQTPTPTPAQVKGTETPKPSTRFVEVPDSTPITTGLGINVMQAANWRGFLLAQFRLTNMTTSERTFTVCILANRLEWCKTEKAPANSSTKEVRWDYWQVFGLTPGTQYNLWYTATVAGIRDPVLGQRNLTTSELPQIGMDVVTQVCIIGIQPSAIDATPRADPNMTVTVEGTIRWADHLDVGESTGWIVITSTTGGRVPVVIDATWPGLAPARDLIWVETCNPPTPTPTATPRPCYSLGNFVWNEVVIVDGLQGAGEPGVAGVTVTASGSSGTLTTTTDANGYYSFPRLCDGLYVVRFFPPPGFMFTIPDAGNDALDSDAIGGQAIVNLTGNNDTIDAGLIRITINPVICICVEVRDGRNVVRWSLNETANGNFAVFRGTSDVEASANMASPVMPARGAGTREWTDPIVGTFFYWLGEQLPDGSFKMYGPVKSTAAQVCYIPIVAR